MDAQNERLMLKFINDDIPSGPSEFASFGISILLTGLQHCSGQDNLDVNAYPVLIDTLLVLYDGMRMIRPFLL